MYNFLTYCNSLGTWRSTPDQLGLFYMMRISITAFAI